ncbi:protein of unknown function [Rhodovastum atsumiense]|nr:protein of unknown function [Rhodovastum atsumiense]
MAFLCRQVADRSPESTLGIIDTQLVKCIPYAK